MITVTLNQAIYPVGPDNLPKRFFVDTIGCVIHDGWDFSFPPRLQQDLNTYGEHYCKVLGTSNSFLCWNAEQGGFVGNGVTDYDHLYPFYTRDQVDSFLEKFAGSIGSAKVSFDRTYKGVEDTYEVVVNLMPEPV